jgi:excisionase family DNA binding protein
VRVRFRILGITVMRKRNPSDDLIATRDAAPASARLYSIDEAAALLSIGHTLASELIADGKLKSVKVGRRRLIPGPALEKYIAELAAA